MLDVLSCFIKKSFKFSLNGKHNVFVDIGVIMIVMAVKITVNKQKNTHLTKFQLI